MTPSDQSYSKRQLWEVAFASGDRRTFLAGSATEAMSIGQGFQQWNCGSDLTPADLEVVHVERLATTVWEGETKVPYRDAIAEAMGIER